ncbi:acyl-CoA dehydrogenase [Asticcacaulis machinosus]|uniref:Acyl-CoA dehydrogenase n=1 Tax=Asticcacaulis machinosus TaxID=2984211 RepID=A0ABT5HH42_9CAUL|nr:acyl-CoA dehydrogenase [Asticcacaulis machinosus]MDC7674919.1 acyl-CoA dehydrogenase [Asticcacaulis machinosus]
MTFRPSTKDINFCLQHIVDIDDFYLTEGYPDFDGDILSAVLDAAGDMARDVIAPINVVGDHQGARLENGQVLIADGFGEAISAYAEGGWNSLAADPMHGGQGLPKTLEQACFEMFNSANMAFTLNPTLTLGAIEALSAYGSERQKTIYLPRLISGEWSGTMNLTEPQSGSDLSTLTTVAQPIGNGLYQLTGQKIFITWGDHEARENILHLVLARLPDAPVGTKGISLFLCPKYQIDDDGKLGDRNSVRAVGLEHKMGIHASPTCVMAFEGAVAEMVGPPNEGLAAMFVMMNAARLAVGTQGVGIADRAWQQAHLYAIERRQGRSALTGQGNAAIYDHPDVRLTLALCKAKIDAARALCLATAKAYDQARKGRESVRDRARRREDLFVPIAKAWATQVGCDVASAGVQVHGGMGYIEETGAAQHYRDARIAPIYEGTNGIQAADLVGRKLSQDNGLAARELSEDIRLFIKDTETKNVITLSGLIDALQTFDEATNWLIQQKVQNPATVATAASRYLSLCGDLIGGWLLAKGALAAQERLDQGDEDREWLRSKIALYEIYSTQILSAASAHLSAIKMTVAPLEALTAAAIYPD